MGYLLGIDVGTYESKGVLVDQAGRVAAQATRTHTPSIPRAGWAEADAERTWWGDTASLARELVGKAGGREVRAIACSAIAPCVLAVDADGRPLRPAILYGIDTRAEEEIRELTAELGETWILERTGSALSSQAAGPKVLWLRRHEPDVWSRTRRVMTATSYLVYRLTGRVVMDHYTAAAYGPLYDLVDRDWSPRGTVGVCEPAMLPDLAWSAEVAGTVTPEAARATGLRVGTPVAVGTADAAAEAVAGGVLESGDTMLMYGSTLFFIQITDGLPHSRVLWPTVYLEPGLYALAAGMSTAGALARWLRDLVGGGAVAWERLEAEAEAAGPGAEGLLVAPYWSGERTPINDPLARGVIAGLSLRHGRGHLYRAILEGVAYGVRANLEAMEESGWPPRRLVAIGGGTRSRLWTRIVCDVTGREQTVHAGPGACYGDAVLAGVAAGLLPGVSAARGWIPAGAVVRPESAARRFHEGRYALYRDLYTSTRALTHALAEEAMGPRPSSGTSA